MNLKYDNCPNCFAVLNHNTICSNCNTDITKIKTYDMALETFTVLNDRYLLGKVLGKGGFGITYLAQDISTGRRCCIKEYMPSEFARRCSDGVNIVPIGNTGQAVHIYEHGRNRFIEEASTLNMLQSNGTVVDITDFFQQNNTAYFVMEYLDGVSMKRLTAQHGGKLPVEVGRKILEIVGVALIDVHDKNMLHRDISPENILITKNMAVKLIDFGAARDYIKAQDNGMSVLLKVGYAPPEQYSTNGAHGPWSDIYALAATFYTSVSGQKLMDSMFVMQGMKQPQLKELNCGVDDRTSDVIAKAMEIDYRKRYQNMREFLHALGTDINNVRNYIGTDEDVQFSQSGHTAETVLVVEDNVKVNGNIEDSHIVEPVKEKKPVIEVLNSDIGIRKINVPKDSVVRIGRSGECDLIVNKETVVSRVHVMVAYDNAHNKFKVTDVSANGTYLSNGQRLGKNIETYIEPGTVIRLVNDNNSIILNVE